ncbi:MAG: aspartate/tyrosine/aromatic aminotransferase [Gammaproteobacteria bacterium]|nr:aspartate/tyrosine/aromatic aminotransferase [Gammaproteobacteria bacterium]MDH3412192.1 aspartate/tyrosine/aromatic aminotransferase [Gammaproteobacteria bacterium]
MSSTLLAGVAMAPRDPILGVTEAFNSDTHPNKVNLGVGIYYDDGGKVPVLECVRRAEQKIAATPLSRSYLPIDGLQTYDRAVQELLFGADSDVLRDKRVVTAQTLGGTGGLKVGADFLRRVNANAQVWISDPSWENHQALFDYAGFKVNSYPYYDAGTRGVRFDAMIDTLRKLPAGSIAVLHACCHNPTGVDLSPEQWEKVIEVVNARGLMPFLDVAYQGFADGLDPDAHAVRRFAQTCPTVFVSSSFSKSLSLYGERVGALSIVTGSAEEAGRVLSQLKRVIRTNYSNPPTHGGKATEFVLTTPELRTLWEKELGEMRDRIKAVRSELVAKIRAIRSDFDFSFVMRQRGLFSYSGLSKAQVQRLREEYSLYAIDSGRICVAAINSRNIDYVARAITSVLV